MALNATVNFTEEIAYTISGTVKAGGVGLAGVGVYFGSCSTAFPVPVAASLGTPDAVTAVDGTYSFVAYLDQYNPPVDQIFFAEVGLAGYTFVGGGTYGFLSGSSMTVNFTAYLILSISGKITSDGTAPVSGVVVQCGGGGAVSDALGNYTITNLTNLAPGTYSVTVYSACTPSPALYSVTLTTANATGKDFVVTGLATPLTGRVVMQTTNAPVAGAAVAANCILASTNQWIHVPGFGASVLTDATGHYVIYPPAVTPNSYGWYADASKDGLQQTREVEALSGTALPDLVMYVAQYVTISGRVIMQGTGAPVAGIDIRVSGATYGTSDGNTFYATDSQGRYSFQAQWFAPEDSSMGLITTDVFWEIADNGVGLVQISGPAGSEFPTPTDLTGQDFVVMGEGYILIDGLGTGAMVLCNGQSYGPSLQDGFGAFDLEITGLLVADSNGLPVTYTLTPSRPNTSFSPSSATVVLGTGYDTPDYANVTFTPTITGYLVSGQVTGLPFGQICTLAVTGGASPFTVTTDSSGNYSFTGAASTTYTVTPAYPGDAFTPAYLSVPVTWPVTGQNFTAAPVVTTYSLKGTVTLSSVALPGVQVNLSGPASIATATAYDGTYSFNGLLPGTYAIAFSRPGYGFSPAGYPTEVIVSANITGLDAAATQDAYTYSVSGQVEFDSSGLQYVTVYCGGYSTVTDSSGNWTIHALPPGSYTAEAQAFGYQFSPSQQPVYVSGQDVTGIDFTASAAATISGQVTVNGTGLAGAQITAGAFTATTSGTGAWQIAGLTVGQAYQVGVTLDGYIFAPVSQSVTVALGGNANVNFAATAIGDTTPPVVNILTPLSGATLTLDQLISWSASDNVGVVTCQVLIDGNLQVTIPGVSGTAPVTYSWTWLLSGWSNGTHAIEVTATDAAGNVGSASITVTLNRSLATETKYRFTTVVGTPGGTFTGKTLDLSMLIPNQETLPEDPLERYNVTCGLAIPGDSINFGDGSPAALAAAFAQFTIINPYKSVTPLTAGSTWRAALCGQPVTMLTYWQDTAHTTAQQFIPLPTGDLAVLASPAALLKLTLGTAPGNPQMSVWESILAPPAPGGGGSMTTFTALWSETIGSSGLDPVTPTITSACYYDGKVLLAAGSYLAAKDVDTGDLTIALALPSWQAVDAVAAPAAGPAYVATWNGTTASLYAFSWASTTKLCDLPHRVTTLAVSDSGCWAGDASGIVGVILNGNYTAVYNTTAPHVNRVVQDGTVTWALTGDAGGLYRSAPAWQLDNTFALTELYAAATFAGGFYLGGNGGDLWQLLNETWANWMTIDGVTAINDMYVPADGSALYLAVTHTSGARVYRLEFAAASGFQSGPVCPDYISEALRDG